MRTSDERMVGDNVKKRITTILLAILIPTLVIVGTCLIIFQIVKKEEESKGLTFYLPRSTSFASNWNYEISDKSIIKETASEIFDSWYYKYDYLEFETEQSGEVTIYFIAQYETQVVEENCFSITYYVDENGNITEISSENKPDKVNFDDDIIGLVWLKTVDRLQVFVINFVIIIYDIISFMIDNKYPWLFQFHFR